MILALGVNGTGKTTTVGKLAHRLKAHGPLACCSRPPTRSAQPPSSSSRNGASARTCRSSRRRRAPIRPRSCTTRSSPRARAASTSCSPTRRAGCTRRPGSWTSSRRSSASSSASTRPRRTKCCSCSTRAKARTRSRKRCEFHERLGVTGLAITKLDGTAKGGILLAIARELALPIRFVALGEGVDDLEEFRAERVRARADRGARRLIRFENVHKRYAERPRGARAA